LREPAARLAERIGHKFRHPALIEQALTHRSAGNPHNERLEFLGDAILGFIIADELHARFPDADEGSLSRLRARLVRKTTLAALARQLDVGEHLRLGPGELRSGGHARDSILADALEALFAAVYLDGGYAEARVVIQALYAQRLAGLSGATVEKDPKTRLQESLQAVGRPLPEYVVEAVTGEQHAQEFRVICRLAAPEQTSKGTGSSRRRAEQDAAERMLAMLHQDG
jgi:ribonuclease-3